jgi:hypothetical protein
MEGRGREKREMEGAYDCSTLHIYMKIA